jgi:hypothetical protein
MDSPSVGADGECQARIRRHSTVPRWFESTRPALKEEPGGGAATGITRLNAFAT